MLKRGHRLLPALERGDDHDGAEGLFFSDEHVVLNIGEDRGLEEETWRQTHNQRERYISA